MTNPDTLWAREGDEAQEAWRSHHTRPFSLLSSMFPANVRADARRRLHGFDFRVESVNGQKTLVKEEAQ